MTADAEWGNKGGTMKRKHSGTAVPKEPEQLRKDRIIKAASMRTRMKASAKLYQRKRQVALNKEE